MSIDKEKSQPSGMRAYKDLMLPGLRGDTRKYNDAHSLEPRDIISFDDLKYESRNKRKPGT